jgi:hypothetical protein
MCGAGVKELQPDRRGEIQRSRSCGKTVIKVTEVGPGRRAGLCQLRAAAPMPIAAAGGEEASLLGDRVGALDYGL